MEIFTDYCFFDLLIEIFLFIETFELWTNQFFLVSKYWKNVLTSEKYYKKVLDVQSKLDPLFHKIQFANSSRANNFKIWFKTRYHLVDRVNLVYPNFVPNFNYYSTELKAEEDIFWRETLYHIYNDKSYFHFGDVENWTFALSSLHIARETIYFIFFVEESLPHAVSLSCGSLRSWIEESRWPYFFSPKHRIEARNVIKIILREKLDLPKQDFIETKKWFLDGSEKNFKEELFSKVC